MTVRALLVGGLSAAISTAWVWAQAPGRAVPSPTPPARGSRDLWELYMLEQASS
jgi:hypothetical protein